MVIGTEAPLEGPCGLVVDPHARAARVGKIELQLSRREFDFLRTLLERRGSVVSYDEMAREVWGHSVATTDRRYILTTAWRVRRALARAGAAEALTNVRGVGYSVPAKEFASEIDQPAVLLVESRDGRDVIVGGSDAALALSGTSRADHPPARVPPRDVLPDSDRARILHAIQTARRSGSAETRGIRYTRPDGSRVRIDIRYTGVGRGNPETVICHLDVREQLDRLAG